MCKSGVSKVQLHVDTQVENRLTMSSFHQLRAQNTRQYTAQRSAYTSIRTTGGHLLL